MFLTSNKDSKDRKILEKHVAAEKKLLDLFYKETLDIDEIVLSIESIRKLNQIDDLKIFIPNHNLNSELLNSFEECKKEISLILKILNENEVPTLNIKYLIKFLNIFEEKMLKNVEEEKKINIKDIENIEGKVVLINKTETIPLYLKNGRKIVLTNINFDFSNFTYDELIEILRVLDVMILDNRYDILRSELAKQISSIESISSISSI